MASCVALAPTFEQPSYLSSAIGITDLHNLCSTYLGASLPFLRLEPSHRGSTTTTLMDYGMVLSAIGQPDMEPVRIWDFLLFVDCCMPV